MMKNGARIVASIALGLFLAGAASADTLELKDGRVLHGRYLGGTQAVLRFEINGQVQTFYVSETVALTFTGDPNAASASASGAAPAPAAPVETASVPPPQEAPPPEAAQRPIVSQDVPPQAARPAPQVAPTPAEDPAAQYGEVTIPAGQALLVRMIDGVDSSRNQVGDVFRASLETDLYVRGTLVARKGTDVYGRLANAKEAGHLGGKSELQLELIRIVIDGHDYPLVSSDYSVQGKSRGADTAKKVGGGAIFGAIIGAIAGGGQGAAIGAGVGSAAGATVQVLTKGQQVRVPSETLLEFRLQQPAAVTPTQG
ncbi:MAG TPA: hypothetical protein VMI32_07115 [Candidatus Solibacter sp.]|nr:hypothetical protein [Candidatus Solibacter sp.]